MTYAILILSHGNLPILKKLINYFNQDCELFIHIDKKYSVDPKIINTLSKKRQVKYIGQTNTINWGGTSILRCELQLLNKALKQSKAQYFHLISGQDYPLRPLTLFLDFFQKHKNKNFIQYKELTTHYPEEKSLQRFLYYFFYDYVNPTIDSKKWVKEQVFIQQRKNKKRPLPNALPHLYCGSQWFSINRKTVQLLINYTLSFPLLYKQLSLSFAPEESYIPTTLLNLLNPKTIINHNYRFIRWCFENNNCPANLGAEHFIFLLQTDAFFARKFDQKFSPQLIKLIDKYLLKNNTINITPNGIWEYDGFIDYEYNEQFFHFILKFCHSFNINDALDMGCGCGLYVTLWRKANLNFSGYDGNPYTSKLSKKLLPSHDTPCYIADLTDPTIQGKPFELVVCKDVLPYLPSEKLHIGLKNLAKLTSKYLILSWNSSQKIEKKYLHTINSKKILLFFSVQHFQIEQEFTQIMRKTLKWKNCFVLSKKELL